MWLILDKVSAILQLLSVFPWLLTAYLFWSRASRYKRLLKKQEGTMTSKPKALAVGLVGSGDITGQVAQFLSSNKMDMQVYPYFKDIGKGITTENISEALRDLLKIKAKLTSEGVTEVHLFLAAPVAMAAAIGAILDNWVPVKVYQPNKSLGGYELWTVLHKGYVPGIEDSLTRNLIEAEL